MRRQHARAAFTLVELLVVIAIIMILASITYPALMRAQIQTREANCRSNLKQIATGLYAYALNYDRIYIANRPPVLTIRKTPDPVFSSYDDLSPLFGVWSARIERERDGTAYKFTYTIVKTEGYVQDVRAFNCPTTRDLAGTLPNKDEWYTQIRIKRTGHAMRFVWSSPVYKIQTTPPADQVPQPQLSYEYCGEFNPGMNLPHINSSKAWLVHDEDAANENIENVVRYGVYDSLQLTKNSNHGRRGGNILFLDSHVEWVGDRLWAARIGEGIKEWETVTAWRLPDGYFGIP